MKGEHYRADSAPLEIDERNAEAFVQFHPICRHCGSADIEFVSEPSVSDAGLPQARHQSPVERAKGDD